MSDIGDADFSPEADQQQQQQQQPEPGVVSVAESEETSSSVTPIAQPPLPPLPERQHAPARSVIPVTECAVSRVTVYLDRAEVCRVIAVTVPPGQSQILISDLTPAIDKDSIRVEVKGAGSSLTDVAYAQHSDPDSEARKQRQLGEAEAKLRAEQRSLQSCCSRLARLHRQRDVLNSYSEMLISKPAPADAPAAAAAADGEDKQDGKQSSSSSPRLMEAYNPQHMDTLTSFFDLYDKQAGKLDEEIIECRIEIQARQQAIAELEIRLADIENEFSELMIREAEIQLESQEAAQVELQFSYVVARAKWTPKYDVRVFSNESVMKINYFGMVQQQTGEIWENAQIRLSTSQPGVGGSAPPPGIQRAHFKSSKVLSVSTGGSASSAASAAAAAAAAGGAAAAAAAAAAAGSGGGSGSSCASPVRRAQSMRVQPVASRRSTRLIEESLIGCEPEDASLMLESQQQQQQQQQPQQPQQQQQLSPIPAGAAGSSVQSMQYDAPRLYTIPSDGADHKVTIGIIDLCPSFEFESVPQRAPYAYLKAAATNTSNYALLQGPANIYVDNSFVAKSELNAVAPTEEFHCNLGADHGIRIVYKPMFKKKDLNQKVNSYSHKQVIELHNQHQKPIKLLVMESLPYAMDDKIKVTLQEPQIKHQDKYDRSKPVRINKNKCIEWDVELDAKESKEIVLRYCISFPAGESLGFSVSDV